MEIKERKEELNNMHYSEDIFKDSAWITRTSYQIGEIEYFVDFLELDKTKKDTDRKGILINYLSQIKIKAGNFWITPLPNFTGSFWRVSIGNDVKEFSVYLDLDDSLGCVLEPYFEIYRVDNNVSEDEYVKPLRFKVSQIDRMNAWLEDQFKN